MNTSISNRELELRCSYFQSAAADRLDLQPASTEPRKETERGGGQVGSYLGLGSRYLPGSCLILPHSKPQFLLNGNDYIRIVITENHKLRSSLFPEPRALATLLVLSGHPLPLLGLCLPKVSLSHILGPLLVPKSANRCQG